HAVRGVPCHGGWLRWYASPVEQDRPRSIAVAALLREERDWGADRADCYLALAQRVRVLRDSLRGLLGRLKRQGKRLAAYGASAKGSTLLNYCGIGRETLDFVADRSTVKQGLFTPGPHLPIC